jgi:hypothetical protein
MQHAMYAAHKECYLTHQLESFDRTYTLASRLSEPGMPIKNCNRMSVSVSMSMLTRSVVGGGDEGNEGVEALVVQSGSGDRNIQLS